MAYDFKFFNDTRGFQSLTVCECQSFMFTFREHTYVVVYGNYWGEWFAAIPNWNVSAVIWSPNQISYNTEQLLDALDTDYADASAVAEAIFRHASERGLVEAEECM